jgi:hypothetical protein
MRRLLTGEKKIVYTVNTVRPFARRTRRKKKMNFAENFACQISYYIMRALCKIDVSLEHQRAPTSRDHRRSLSSL